MCHLVPSFLFRRGGWLCLQEEPAADLRPRDCLQVCPAGGRQVPSFLSRQGGWLSLQEEPAADLRPRDCLQVLSAGGSII